MIVVNDSTTLIILANQQRFDLLHKLFDVVYVPSAVLRVYAGSAYFHHPATGARGEPCAGRGCGRSGGQGQRQLQR